MPDDSGSHIVRRFRVSYRRDVGYLAEGLDQKRRFPIWLESFIAENGQMGRKSDLREVDDMARKFKMTESERIDFGDFLEACKADGDRGTKNDRGDFTWKQLEQKAREFLDLSDGE